MFIHSPLPILVFLAIVGLLGLFLSQALAETDYADTLLRFFLYGNGFKRNEFWATLVASNAGLSGAFVLILYYGFMFGRAIFPWVWFFWILTQAASVWTIKRSERLMQHRGGWLHRFGTMHELIGEVFQSPRARRYAGLLSVFAYVGLVGCELLLAYRVAQYFLTSPVFPGIKLEAYPFIFLVTILLCIVIYCAMAGFRGAVKTDIAQLIVMSLMIVVVALFVISDETPGNPNPAVVFRSTMFTFNPDGKGAAHYLSFIISNIAFWALWWPGAMDQWQRCAATTSKEKALDQYRGIIGVVPVIYFGALSAVFVWAGEWLAKHLSRGTTLGPDLLGQLAASVDSWSQHQFGVAWGVVVGSLVPVGLICAAMSTMDTYVITISQCLFADVMQPRGAPTVLELDKIDKDGRLLAGARAVTLLVPFLIVGVAILIGRTGSDIYEFIYFSFSFMFATLPVLYVALIGGGHAMARKAAELSLVIGGVCCAVGYTVIIRHLHFALHSRDAAGSSFWYQWLYWWPVVTALVAGLALGGFWPHKKTGANR